MKTKTRFTGVLCLLGALGLALGCDVQRGSGSPTAPTTPEAGSPAAPSSVSGPQLTGYWKSATGAAPAAVRLTSTSSSVASLSSCDNFRLHITSQNGNSASGTFSVVCLGAYQVAGTAAGTVTGGSSARIELSAATTVQGVGNCPVTVTSDASIEGDTIRLPFVAQTCLGNFTGTETLRKSDLFPSPAPAPTAPPPAPEPPPPPAPPVSADELDLNAVRVVLGPTHVASWPQTSTIVDARSGGGQLCVNHTRLGRWPQVLFFDTGAYVEANQWVFANVGGQWVGGAGEWIRPGQECKVVDAQSIGRDAFSSPQMEPLRSWVPRPGEVFGVMVTTPARAWPNMTSTNERSNVVLLRWAD